jgi:Na+:H+ antiporter, NhaA family
MRALAVIVLTLACALPVQSQTGRSAADFMRFFTAQPRVPLIISNDGAKVLVVKFNDFQCPPCAETHLQYKSLFAKYEAQRKGSVKLVKKDFPLNRDCNEAIQRTLHPSACDAAVAVRLAQRKNRAEALEDYFYTHQAEMTPAMIRQAARDIGQVTDFEAKYQSTLVLVKGDVALARQLGIRSTPTFFVNGVKLEGGLPPELFDQAIQYELSRSK